MTSVLADAQRYVRAIFASGLSIYDEIPVGHPDLWIPSPQLEALLDRGLRGLQVEGLPLRTRSKVVKTAVCSVLGYPAPKSFKKTQPRFPGQCFDTYVQKANNLQVWNEELSATRRYAIMQCLGGKIARVKVVTGESLAVLATTGTLTQKYQRLPSCAPDGRTGCPVSRPIIRTPGRCCLSTRCIGG